MNTAKKMYEYFLVEIRKERNTTISPKMWTAYINPIVIDWVKTKLPLKEFVQKRIDDLEAIKILTNGQQYSLIPSNTFEGNVFKIPYNEKLWPPYFYGISAQFGTTFGDSDEDPGGGEEISENTITPLNDKVAGKILRSDDRVVLERNVYRQPDDFNYVYYDNREGFIYVTSKEKKYTRMILEYYRYPLEIAFAEGIDDPGSFKAIQNKEIMDMAVKRYLGRASDPRLQSQAALDSQIPI